MMRPVAEAEMVRASQPSKRQRARFMKDWTEPVGKCSGDGDNCACVSQIEARRQRSSATRPTGRVDGNRDVIVDQRFFHQQPWLILGKASKHSILTSRLRKRFKVHV